MNIIQERTIALAGVLQACQQVQCWKRIRIIALYDVSIAASSAGI